MTARAHAAPLAQWWGNLPLRSRLAAVAAIVVALAVGMSMAVAYVQTSRSLRGQLDSQLRHQAEQLQQQAAASAAGGFPVLRLHVEFGQPGGYAQVVDPRGLTGRPRDQETSLPVSAADRRIAATQQGGTFRNSHVGTVPVRMLTSPLIDGYAVQVALPLGAVDNQLNDLAVAFTVVAAVALVIAIALAWWLTRTTLAPVARLTATAEQITATRDLAHRITTETRDDEIGRLAASFNSMLDALGSSLTAQRQLVADASHELRTPLASLRTNTEVLADFDRLTPAQRDQVRSDIVGQIDELTALIADVLELARGDEPVETTDLVAFDGVVAHAVAQARRHWPAVRFELALNPVTVRGIPGRLDRAVRNLLDNAAKFSGAGSSVDVHLDATGVLFVRDRGPGVAPDALPHVFERFYRADDARGMPGSGLGLAIVKQAADRHRGTAALVNMSDVAHTPGETGVLAILHIPPATDAVGQTPQSGAPEPVEISSPASAGRKA